VKQDTADFYEKLEDGFITLPPTPKTVDYKMPGENATRDELWSAYGYTKQQAANTEHKIDKSIHAFWVAAAEQIWARREALPRTPLTKDQLLAREAQRIHDEYSMEANVRK